MFFFRGDPHKTDNGFLVVKTSTEHGFFELTTFGRMGGDFMQEDLVNMTSDDRLVKWHQFVCGLAMGKVLE